MDDHIVCPHCGQKIPVAQAIYHKIEEQHRRDIDKQIAEEKLRAIHETEAKMKREFEKNLEHKLKESLEDAEEAKKQNQELRSQLLELTKTLRDVKQKEEMRELEMEKKLLSERDKIQKEVAIIEKERSDLEKKALQKQLDDTKKALEEARRKADQTSQQLQGEVLELNLEEQLKQHFPKDEIVPIEKGVEGGDILQKIKSSHHQDCGAILWETKRTKSWSKSWLPKLRDDARGVNASISILVSHVLPPEVSSFHLIERVYVTGEQYAIPLAHILRGALVRIAEAKQTVANKDEKLEMLHRYIMSEKFFHRFEAQAESVIGLKNDLDTEKRALKRIWKQREMEIERMMNNLAYLYGEFKGILGPTLPPIKNFELPSGSEDDEVTPVKIDE